jgi:hypothetical protein
MRRSTDDTQRPPTSTERPSLPANRAFVLQFAEPGGRDASLRGRIEHVTTGRTAFFASWEQARDFVERALAEVDDQAK